MDPICRGAALPDPYSRQRDLGTFPATRTPAARLDRLADCDGVPVAVQFVDGGGGRAGTAELLGVFGAGIDAVLGIEDEEDRRPAVVTNVDHDVGSLCTGA